MLSQYNFVLIPMLFTMCQECYNILTLMEAIMSDHVTLASMMLFHAPLVLWNCKPILNHEHFHSVGKF